MERRGFLAAGAASVATVVVGCVSAPVTRRPPDFVFDGFQAVTEVEVDGTGGVFVAGTTDDGGARVVELNDDGRTVWRFGAGALAGDPYVEVEPRTVFVSQSPAPLLAVDRDTRSITWRKADVRTSSFPVSDGVAYPSVGNRIAALAVDDGRTRWNYEIDPDRYLAPVAMVGDTLVCSGGGGRITGLSVDDGSERWMHALGGDLPPTTHRDGTVFAGTGTNADDPKAVAIDAASGDIRWTIRRTDGIVSPDVGPRNVFLPPDGPGPGTIAVDPASGEERWQRSGVSVVHAGEAGPVGTARSGTVVALDPLSGQERWRLDAATWDGTWPEVAMVGSTVLVVAPDGITVVDHESGRRRWRHRVSVERHPWVEYGGSVVAVESGGTVLGFRLES